MWISNFIARISSFKHKKKKHSFWFDLLGYEPESKSQYLYTLSLIHKTRGMPESNERLEYLGDAVISLIVADKLYELYPDEREGFLTRARAKCVCRDNLNIVGEKLHLEQYLNTTQSLMQKSPNIYGNTFEAIVGAIYLDKGMEQAKAFVQQYVIGDNNHLLKRMVEKELDFKSRLLEWGQLHKHQITFDILSDAYTASTDTHNFVCCVKIDDKEICQAAGANKQLAHQAAAKRAMNAVNKIFS